MSPDLEIRPRTVEELEEITRRILEPSWQRVREIASRCPEWAIKAEQELATRHNKEN